MISATIGQQQGSLLSCQTPSELDADDTGLGWYLMEAIFYPNDWLFNAISVY